MMRSLVGVARQPGWRGRLHAVRARHLRQPFRYGVQDCAAFAGECVEAIIGVDPMAEFRGRYKNRDEAMALLAAEGFASLAEAAGFLFAEISPSRAVAGDLALVDPGLGTGAGGAGDSLGAIGLVIGAEIMVTAPTGIGVVPLEMAVRAFKVG